MNDFMELRRVTGMLSRRWWLVATLTLVAAAAGFLISLNLDPVYEATTSIVVGQAIQAISLDTRDIQTSERLALSYADIARRQPVLEAAIVSLNPGYDWQTLRKRVQVNLVPGTQLLEISVESGSRDEAIRLADEIARQLVLLSPGSQEESQAKVSKRFIDTRIEAIQDRIEASQARLDELSTALLDARTAERRVALQAEIEALENKIISWEENYTKLAALAGSGESANYLTVVEKAHAKESPVRPLIRLNTLIAGVVGFVAALGLVFLLEFLDDTMKSVEDIREDLELTPLGAIGQFGSRDLQNNKIVAQDPFSPFTESYRIIRNNIQFMSLDKPGKSILVTSPEPGDGKSITAANFAVVTALNGKNTIIVDTDLRKPQMHKIFDRPNRVGLTNKLRDEHAEIPLIDTEIDGLRLLTAGDLPPNPSELLGSQKMGKLIEELAERADVLIFDCPPVAYIVDAAVLSKQVDGVVLVVSAGKTRRDSTRQALFNLQQAGANILGVILNRVPERNGAYKYKYRIYSDSKAPVSAAKRPFTNLRIAWSSLSLAIGWKVGLRD